MFTTQALSCSLAFLIVMMSGCSADPADEPLEDAIDGGSTDQPESGNDCFDGLDNDGNGWADCNDYNCAAQGFCTEYECGDFADNDRDGAFDCDDSDCRNAPNCASGVQDAGVDTNVPTDTSTPSDTSASPDTSAAMDAPEHPCPDHIEPNACGGCSRLDRQPGDSCGECGNGALVCAGPGTLACENDSVNACGGCIGPLEGTPGTPCDTCGAVLSCFLPESLELLCNYECGKECETRLDCNGAECIDNMCEPSTEPLLVQTDDWHPTESTQPIRNVSNRVRYGIDLVPPRSVGAVWVQTLQVYLGPSGPDPDGQYFGVVIEHVNERHELTGIAWSGMVEMAPIQEAQLVEFNIRRQRIIVPGGFRVSIRPANIPVQSAPRTDDRLDHIDSNWIYGEDEDPEVQRASEGWFNGDLIVRAIVKPVL